MVKLAKNLMHKICYKHVSNVYTLFLSGRYYIFYLCFVHRAKMCPRNLKILWLNFFPPSFTLGCNLFCQKCKEIHFSNLTGKNWKEPGTGQYDVTQ